MASALTELDQFRSIEEHARAIDARLAGPQHRAAIRPLLDDLVAAGDLFAHETILAGCRAAARADVGASIRQIGFVTCDRAEALQRAVASFAENTIRHETPCELVVTDDSPHPAARARHREMLVSMRDRLGVSVAYTGRDEKEAYAVRLARESHVDDAVVRFALLGVDGLGFTVGANRNALLLDAAGEAFVSADDDTEARVAAPPRARDALVLTALPPEEVWAFRDRESVVAATRPHDESVIRLHESVLGRKLTDVVATATTEVDLTAITVGMLQDLASDRGRVALSLTGTYGDSGMSSPAALLLLAGTPSGERLTTKDAYDLAISSREIVRCATATTITHASVELMTTSLAIDHRELLPPFLPICERGEDTLFGLLMSACDPSAYSVFHPRAIAHAPEGRGRYTTFVPGSSTPSLANLLALCLADGRRFARASTVAGRMRAVGRELVELGRADIADFAHVTRTRNVALLERHAETLASILNRELPSPWRAHLEAWRARLAHDVADDRASLPSELVKGRTEQEARALGQQVVGRFGALLAAWPDIVAAAKRMRARGERLAQKV